MSSKVTVIVPSYNHKAFIAETISSILSQSYHDFELIVIDDGSKDGSREFLQELADKHKFKLILKENEGICLTLNKGLELATGEFITFIASDDLMTPDRLSQQVDFLKNHAEVEIVAGAVNMIDIKSYFISTKLPKVKGFLTFDDLLSRNLIFAPTVMFRKAVFEKYGFYKANYVFEDYYLWLKVLKAGGKIFNTVNIWADYRINETNFEKRFNWYNKGYNQVLSDYLPDERVVKKLKKYQLIYFTKMSLLLGSQLFSKYKEEVIKLPLVLKTLIRIISFIPEIIRHKTLHFLLRNY